MTLVDRPKRTEMHSVLPQTTIVTGNARIATRAVVATAHTHLVRIDNLDH
jgi:hypothetical protein